MTRVTTQSNTKNAVSAQVRILPTLLGIFKISCAIRGYRVFTQNTPRKPQKIEYTRQMREELTRQVCEKVRERDSRCACNVTAEYSYQQEEHL